MNVSVNQREQRMAWRSLHSWGTVVGLVGGIVGLLGGGLSLLDRWMPPSLQVLDFHPVFLWKPRLLSIGGDDVHTAERGVGAIVRVRSGNRAVSVSGIEYSGDLRLSLEEWIGFFGRDGMSPSEVDAEYVKAQAFQSVAFTGWLADTGGPVRLEPHEEIYLRFLLVAPSASGQNALLIDRSYIGLRGKTSPKSSRRFWPQPLDFFIGKPHPDGWMARGLRDEVGAGAARFTILAGGGGIKIPIAAIRPTLTIGVEEWGRRPAESMLSTLP